jgi:hypothetical protein
MCMCLLVCNGDEQMRLSFLRLCSRVTMRRGVWACSGPEQSTFARQTPLKLPTSVPTLLLIGLMMNLVNTRSVPNSGGEMDRRLSVLNVPPLKLKIPLRCGNDGRHKAPKRPFNGATVVQSHNKQKTLTSIIPIVRRFSLLTHNRRSPAFIFKSKSASTHELKDTHDLYSL